MTTILNDLVHADPWTKVLVDLPSLNAAASDAIIRTIASMRRTARESPASLRGRSIVVLGPAGAGKTHLFARLRRAEGPKAVFVHMRPLIGAEMTPRYVLREVVAQLAFETHGFRQSDALVGSLVGHLEGSSTQMPRAFLEVLSALGEEERESQLEAILEQVVERWSQVDEIYLRKLLQLPFVPSLQQRALFAWLSGREPDEMQLSRIGMREGLRDDLVMPALKTLGAMAAPGAPIVIVFDQLENLVDAEGGNRVRAYGNLIAELVDEVRGVVLVQMALDSEWKSAIEPELAMSQKTRATMDRQTLALPTPAQREGLVRLWSERLPGHASFPAPFGTERLRQWREAPGLTPRMLLIECMRALEEGDEEGGKDPLSDIDDAEQVGEAIGLAWSEHLVRARRLLDEAAAEERSVEAEVLADGWSAAIRVTPTLRVLSTSHLRPAQIIVDRGKDRVQLALLSKVHPRSLLASMDALARMAEREQVLVVRELSQPFKPTWKASLERRESLMRLPRVQWFDLTRDDAVRLLALRSLLADARSRDVTDLMGRPLEEGAVRAWVDLALEVPSWRPMEALRDFVFREIESSGEGSENRGLEGKDTSSTPGREKVREAMARGPNTPGKSSNSPTRAPARRSDPMGGVQPTGVGAFGEALLVLSRLRVASVERVVREVFRVAPGRTRRSVLEELRSDRVRWFGRTVVAWKEQTW